MNELSYALGWAGTAMQVLAIVVGALRWQRLSQAQRVLLAMLGLVLLNYIASRVFISHVRNSYPFFYSYIAIEFAFLAVLFRGKLLLLRSASVTYGIIAAVLLFTTASGAFWQSYWVFPSHARMLESLLVVAFCALYFVQVLRKLDVENLERTFMFWVTTGLLVYFATNAVITVFGSTLSTEEGAAVFGAIWSIHGVLNILLYLAFTIAFLCHDRAPASSGIGMQEVA